MNPSRNGHSVSVPDRIPPCDNTAEQAVIGCVLLDWQPSMAACIAAIGTAPDVFFEQRHQEIYRIMAQMYDAQEPIDLVTLQSWLGFQGLLEGVGGIPYLTELMDAAPSAANIQYYLDILQEKLRYRRLIRYSSQAVVSAYDGNGTASELINDAAENILGLVEEAIPRQQESCIHDLIPGALEQIEQWHGSQGVTSGISTGFPELDKLTTGFHPGDLIVIAGRPSLGKTSVCMNIVENVAVAKGLPVGVFSLEMTKESLTLRMLCSQARVNLRSIRDGFLAERDFPKLSAAAGKLHGAKIYINDQSGLSILELRTRARRMRQQYGIQLLVVDYIQLMHADRNRNDSRDREVGLISGGLKSLAKELAIPVIAISQLNRSLEREKERRPRLSDLRESGNVEQDADLVGILWKPSRKDDDDGRGDSVAVNLEILKQRNGPTGTVPLTFLRGYTRFESQAKVTEADVPEPEYQPPYADPEPMQPELSGE